jgi:hypothetical protein
MPNTKTNMPVILEQFLTDLQSEQEITEIRDWLDGNPNAPDEIIDLLNRLLLNELLESITHLLPHQKAILAQLKASELVVLDVAAGGGKTSQISRFIRK